MGFDPDSGLRFKFKRKQSVAELLLQYVSQDLKRNRIEYLVLFTLLLMASCAGNV
jgi:hypothetical protein